MFSPNRRVVLSQANVLVEEFLKELIESSRWQWATFETPDKRFFIEVAPEQDNFVLNIAFPFYEDYQVKFDKCGILIRETWAVTGFKPKGILFAGFLELTVDRKESEHLGAFIVQLFVGLYDLNEDCEIVGRLQ